jgi:hypothetical protein
MSAPKQAAFLRDAFQSIIDRFEADSERLVLFTTFNFRPDFFEANLLPLLAGDTVADLAGVSETRHAINEELKKIGVLVVNDRSMRPEPKGDMRYGCLSVGLPQGRFHPKLMLMAGTLKDTGQPGLWLFVGSGNLTLSGWTRNREIVGVTPVAHQHADELTVLLRWIQAQAQDQLDGVQGQEEGDMRQVLDKLLARLQDETQLHADYPGMPSLHLALPFDQRPPLLETLTAGRTWRRASVVSPYWSDVPALVTQLGVEACQFVPSLSKTGYAFPISTLKPPEQHTFGKFGDDQYTHAKAMLLEQVDGRRTLCIGSANFTAAALKPVGMANVEAVLRYELPAGTSPWAPFQPLDRALLDDTAGKAEEELPLPLLPVDVAVHYDWKKHEFGGHLTVIDADASSDITLEVVGQYRRFEAQLGLRQQIAPIHQHCTTPPRAFIVRWRDAAGKTGSYSGVVLQVGAEDDQLLYEPRPRLDKILELLRSLDPSLSEEELRKRAARRRNDGGGDGEQDEGDASYDYFGLFQATWKLRAHLQRRLAARETVPAYDSTSPYCITTLYRAITLQPAAKINEKIGRYIQLIEVRELMESLTRAGLPVPDDSPCREIGQELDALLEPIRTALAGSASFQNMFGRRAPAQVEIFLRWFHDEMKKEEAPHA